MSDDGKHTNPAELKRMFDQSPRPVVVADATQKTAPLVYVNAAFEAMTGFGPSDALGRNCRFMQKGDLDQPGLTLMRAAIREQKPIEVILRNYTSKGALFVNKLTMSPYRADGDTVTHFIGMPWDVTREKQLEQQLLDAQAIDPLTCTLNRPHFWQNAAVAIHRSQAQDLPLSVVKIDIDHFHTINDAYGFGIGDMVLKRVADALRHEVKHRDLLARIGSDEFAVLMPGAQLGVARGAACHPGRYVVKSHRICRGFRMHL
jgi:PAS domain S-box-containing protein